MCDVELCVYLQWYTVIFLPSVLWCCWLAGRKGIRPVKTEWWGAGVVICLEWGADLHMPSWCHCHSLSLASVKSRLVLHFWYRPTLVVLEKGPLNGCVLQWYTQLQCLFVCDLCELEYFDSFYDWYIDFFTVRYMCSSTLQFIVYCCDKS